MSEFNEELLVKTDVIAINEYEYHGMKINDITPCLQKYLRDHAHPRATQEQLDEAVLEFDWYYENLTLNIKYNRFETEGEREGRRTSWVKSPERKTLRKKTQREKDEAAFEKLRKKLGK